MTFPLHVFVYGTLKPGEANYAAYCAGKISHCTPAYTWGTLYHLKKLGYPALTTGTSKVQGYLLTFTDASALPYLDRLETYDPQRNPQENQYNRQILPIYDEKTHKILCHAWVYLMDKEKIHHYGGEQLPTGKWTGNQRTG